MRDWLMSPRTVHVMASEQRRIRPDSGDAYARAVRREEQQQERQQQDLNDDKFRKSVETSETDEASDLFRQHSHQQAMEGG